MNKALWAWCLVFCIVFTACAKQTTHTVVAANESKQTEDNAGKTEKAEAETSVEAAKTNAVQQVLQATIDLPELQQYFHETEPNRKPLRVIKNGIVKQSVSLTKFGQAVEFVEAVKAKKKNLPYLEFTSLKIDAQTAEVGFRFKVEGISGKVNLEKNNGKWEIKSHQLVEN